MEKELFSTLPVPTWRWLGVNEAYLPEELQTLPTPVRRIQIDVPAGQHVTQVIANRTEQRTEITAHVAEGGTLQMVQLQLLPPDKAGTCNVEVTAEKDAQVYYTTAEIGASRVLAQVKIDLAGDGSKADMAALYFGDGTRSIDLNYVITQTGKKTEANMQVTGVTFKGVHYEIIVDVAGFKWMIQSTDYVSEGQIIGLSIDPDAIHIMKKSEFSGMFGDYSSFSDEFDELDKLPEEETEEPTEE